MQADINIRRLLLIVTLILGAAFSRLIPHWPNFTPIAAIAIFGGATFSKKSMAWLIPFFALFLSDLILGFHHISTMIAVYFSFFLISGIGILIRQNKSIFNISIAVFASSILFFLITNFAAWLSMPFYEKSFSGLISAYIAGIAFFNQAGMGVSFFINEMMGTAFYCSVLFGSFYLLEKNYPAFREKAIYS